MSFKPRPCVQCGRTFEPTGAKSRFCGNECRLAAQRERGRLARAAQPKPPRPERPQSGDAAGRAALDRLLRRIEHNERTVPDYEVLVAAGARRRAASMALRSCVRCGTEFQPSTANASYCGRACLKARRAAAS